MVCMVNIFSLLNFHLCETFDSEMVKILNKFIIIQYFLIYYKIAG